MSNGRKDLCAGIFFILFAAFLYVESFAINMSKADALGPQFFPRMVAAAITILAVVLILKSFAEVRAEKAQKAEKTEENAGEKPKAFSVNGYLLLTMALLVAYFLLVKEVGFVVLTALYLFCQMFVLLPRGSYKKVKYLVIVGVASVLVPTGIYLLFYKVFQIFLPAGILG